MDYVVLSHLLGAVFVFTMAVLGRGMGSASKDEVTGAPTGWPTWDRIAGVVFYSLSFLAASYMLFGNPFIAAALTGASIFMMLKGHGRFYAMKGANINDPNPEWIETYLVLPWYPGDITKPIYSWVCMGIKGLGVGLFVFPYGLPLAILFPLSYYIAFKYTYDSAFAEWARGLFVGLAALYVAATYFFA